MFLVSSCSYGCPIQWSQVFSWEWRCSWSSADRRCSNYIRVIDNFIALYSSTYIRDLTVLSLFKIVHTIVCLLSLQNALIKLSDFGFAKVDDGTLATPHFTPYYVAPQVSEVFVGIVVWWWIMLHALCFVLNSLTHQSLRQVNHLIKRIKIVIDIK